MPLFEALHDLSSPALQTVVHAESSCVDSCVTRWKIIFAAILFVESLLFGHLIYALKAFRSITPKRINLVLHLANAFSGGVFFSTGMLHIFPESIEIFNGAQEEEDDNNSARIGFPSLLTQRQEDVIHEDEHEEHGAFPWPFFVLMISFYFFFFIEQVVLPKVLKGKAACAIEEDDTESLHSETHQHAPKMPKLVEEMANPFEVEKAGFLSSEFATGFVQILGISAHSLFESMALGLSSTFSTVTNIFIATVLHRGFTTVALTIRIVDKVHYLAFLTLLILFSCIVPLGVGIGFAVESLSNTAHGILFSISAGTFAYIGAYEVMAEEFAKHRDWPFTKFAMTMAGVGLISVITGILVAFDIVH